MKLIGLFGHPVSQSMSPAMHNAAFAEMGLPYMYCAFDIMPQAIEEAVNAARTLQMVGFNLTIPHKQTVIPYLDDLDALAQKSGAVNTVVNRDGRLIGYNTDGIGYVTSLEQEMQLAVKDAKILMIGAGGAARGIFSALLDRGCSAITVYNRTMERAKMLVEDFSGLGMLNATDQLQQATTEADIIINTTSVGMYPHYDEMPLEPEHIEARHIVSDIIYNPYETKLLAQAKQRGARAHHGLGMFVYQGAIAFEKWTGHKPPVETMHQIVKQMLLKNDHGRQDKC